MPDGIVKFSNFALPRNSFAEGGATALFSATFRKSWRLSLAWDSASSVMVWSPKSWSRLLAHAARRTGYLSGEIAPAVRQLIFGFCGLVYILPLRGRSEMK